MNAWIEDCCNTVRHSTAGGQCAINGAIDAPPAVTDADRHYFYFNCTLTRPGRSASARYNKLPTSTVHNCAVALRLVPRLDGMVPH